MSTEARAVATAQGLNKASGVAYAVIEDIQANHCSPAAPPPVTAAAAAPANNLPQCIGRVTQQCCNQGLKAGQQCGCTRAL
jgi:hypothetical protein